MSNVTVCDLRDRVNVLVCRETRRSQSLHAHDNAVALNDYFSEVIATALVNAWSTRECALERFGSSLYPAKQGLKGRDQFAISIACHLSH